MKGFITPFLFVIIFICVHGKRVANPCDDGKIPCDNGECVRKMRWCDEEFDCADKSDEKYCKRRPHDTVNHVCSDKHFQCGDGMCFPAAVRCDGSWDCFADTDDEKDCDKPDDEIPPPPLHPQPEYSPTVSAPEPSRQIDAASISTTNDHYDRRRSESWPNSPVPTSPVANYPQPLNPNTYDPNYPDQTHTYRGSDIYPGRNYPSHQQPYAPPHTRDATTHWWQDRTRTREHSFETGYPHIERDTPLIYPPRSVLYPPRTSSTSTRHNVRSPNYLPFYFERNYTKDNAYDYKSVIRDAKAWLLGQRDNSYTWGKDTPRALIALSLITNNFKSDVEENELMRKSLQTYLGIQLLRNETGLETISPTRLAVYINALLATCQDPRDFMGIDLVEILNFRQNNLRQYQRFVNPIIYLTLCLTDMPINVPHLEGHLINRFPTEISKDLHILATTAMACVAQRDPNNYSKRRNLDEAARSLLSQMNPDNGSFGSKYSTALAAQVLMSVNTSLRWNHQKTLNYLSELQQEDGSFGDMQSTYYTLIALSGRSLVHLRNTMCDPNDIKRELTPEDIMNREGERKSIMYTLRIGYPEAFSAGMQLSIHNDTNFFDIMRIAAYQDPRFKFKYEVSKGNLYNVHTIANIPNDPERGMFWTLYRMQPTDRYVDLRHRYLGNIIDFVPNDGEELVYWYLNEI